MTKNDNDLVHVRQNEFSRSSLYYCAGMNVTPVLLVDIVALI
jgi:hypothetical protein